VRRALRHDCETRARIRLLNVDTGGEGTKLIAVTPSDSCVAMQERQPSQHKPFRWRQTLYRIRQEAWARRRHLLIIGYFLLVSVPVLLWFHPGKVLYFTDSTFPFRPAPSLVSSFYLWNPNSGFGDRSLALAFAPYFAALTFLNLFLPLWAAEAVLWYLVVAASGIGMYYLVRRVQLVRYLGVPPWLAPAICGTLYMFSTYWIYVGVQDPTPIVAFYSAFPFLMIVLVSWTRNRRATLTYTLKWSAYLSVVTLFALPSFNSPYVFVYGGIVVGFLAYSALGQLLVGEGIRLRNLYSITGVAIVVLVFAFWWVPFAAEGGGYSSLTPGSSFASTLHYWLGLASNGAFYSILNLPFTQQASAPAYFGWSWFPQFASAPMLPLIYVLAPVLAVAGCLTSHVRKSDFGLFVAILFVVGIALGNGLSPPTGVLYNWMFLHVPFWTVFDSPYRWFSPILYFAYAYLDGVAIVSIIPRAVSLLQGWLERFRNALGRLQRIQKVVARRRKDRPLIRGTDRDHVRTASLKVVLSTAVTGVLLISSIPLLLGEAVPHGVPSEYVELPTYENQLVDYLNSQPGFGRVLSLPLFVNDAQANWSTSGYYGTDPLVTSIDRPLIWSEAGLNSLQTDAMSYLLTAIWSGNTSVISSSLTALNIRYVLVRGDYATDPGQIVSPFNLTRTDLVLSHSPQIEEVADFGPIHVFENGNSRPQAFPSYAAELNASLAKPYGATHSVIDPSSWEPNSHSTSLTNGSWLFVNWGTNYSNLTIDSNRSIHIFFNYTHNVTWTYFVAINNNSWNLNTSLFHYLTVNYTLMNGTNLGFFYGHFGGQIQPFYLLDKSTNSLGQTSATFALPQTLAVIDNVTLILFVNTSSNTHSSAIIQSIQASTFVSDASANWYCTCFGPSYSYLGGTSSGGLVADFNYSAGITWPFLKFSSTFPLSFESLTYSYLVISFENSPGSSLQVYASNETTSNIILSLAQTSTLGEVTIDAFSTSALLGSNVTGIIFTFDVGQQPGSRGTLTILSAQFAIALGLPDFLPVISAGAFSPGTTVITNESVNVAQNPSAVASTSVEVISPSAVRVTFASNVTATFVLVFSQAFDELWSCQSIRGAVCLQHLDANGFFNAWVLSITKGTSIVLLSYQGQTVATDGLIITGTVIVVLALVILVPRITSRKKRKRELISRN